MRGRTLAHDIVFVIVNTKFIVSHSVIESSIVSLCIIRVFHQMYIVVLSLFIMLFVVVCRSLLGLGHSHFAMTIKSLIKAVVCSRIGQRVT